MITDAEIEKIQQRALGTYKPPPRDAFDIQLDALYGGISGFTLPSSEFELCQGLRLVTTYVSVIAPAILAFSPPATKTAPHPGPWAALSGGGLDMRVELQVDAAIKPLHFNRLDTIWFVVALLRLRLARSVQMIVLSDRPFASVPSDTERANLLPAELILAFQPIVTARSKWMIYTG